MCVTASIRQQAEQIKKDLSSKSEVTFSCVMTSTSDSNYKATTPWANGGLLVEFPVTLSEFHQVCDGLFQRSLLPVHRLLNDLGEHSIDFLRYFLDIKFFSFR